ncbi:DUF4158 domain-containing protein [Nonomuraea sp. JJY05]|jgi:hypothetical protein|uniref:DUF4158 domain-containing protein n=1 Tax=Nonomuraea sp. JJY05 TaxID=3350255 RepID=UPI00373FA5E1
MPVDFLSDEKVARYRRFRPEVSMAELEQFFRLDSRALEALASKRRPATKLGWALQWGTVRMLGTFLAEDPLDVRGRCWSSSPSSWASTRGARRST